MFALALLAAVLGGPSAPPDPPADDRARAATLAGQAQTLAAAGDVAAAIARLEEAEAAAPGWAELKVNLAALRSRSADYAGAIRDAGAALAIDPSLDGARYNLGIAQLKAGDGAAAAATLARYAGQPSPAAVQAALGLALAALERHAESASALQAAIETGARDPALLLALIRALEAAGDAAGAEQWRDRLLREAPGSAAALLIEGDALDRGSDWAGAESAYRRAVAADPRLPGAHYSVGLMSYKRRRYDEAARAFREELALQRAFAPALRYLALLELDRGRPSHAVPLLERLSVLAPTDKQVWRDLGRAYLEAGRAPDAVAALRRAVERSPDEPNGHFLLGRALRAVGREAEGAEAMRNATRLNQRIREELQEKVSGSPPPP